MRRWKPDAAWFERWHGIHDHYVAEGHDRAFAVAAADRWAHHIEEATVLHGIQGSAAAAELQARNYREIVRGTYELGGDPVTRESI